MGRWSPTVLPTAPRFARPIDIGGALGELAEGISSRRERNDRLAREQEERDRWHDAENNRRVERALDRQRQGKLDAVAEEDRGLRRERDFLDMAGRAEDDGYVTDAQRAPRQAMARDLKAGGGLAGIGVGDALLAASTGDDEMTLTRPDGTKETRYRDPTRTKEARDENTWRSRQQYLDRQKAPARDPVADELREYEEKLKIDQRYRINDFAPKAPRGGGGGGGGEDTRGLERQVSIARQLAADANRNLTDVEKAAPKAPDFGNPMFRPTDPEARKAFLSDSTKKANQYTDDSTAWEGRKNAAAVRAQQAEKDLVSLSRQLFAGTGDDTGVGSVVTQNQAAAAKEIANLQTRVNAAVAEANGDEETLSKIRAWYTDQVRTINSTYGIRPRPEE